MRTFQALTIRAPPESMSVMIEPPLIEFEPGSASMARQRPV